MHTGVALSRYITSTDSLRKVFERARYRCLFVLVSACMVVGCSEEIDTHALPSEWAQWRGPMGSGVSEESGLPVRWGPRENIQWKAEIPGSANSSPIVTGGLIIVATAEQSGKMVDSSLIALDEESGAVLVEVNGRAFDLLGRTAVPSRTSMRS